MALTFTKTIDHRDTLCSLAFDKDAAFLATGGMDGRVRLWNLANGHQDVSKEGLDAWVESLCFVEDHLTLLVGTRSGTIYVWDTQTGSFAPVTEHGKGPCMLSKSVTGDHIISGGAQGSVHIVKAHGPYREIASYSISKAKVEIAEVHREGHLFAVLCDQKVEVRAVESGTVIWELPSTRAICMAYDGRDRIAVYGGDRTLSLHHLQGGKEPHVLPGMEYPVKYLSFVPFDPSLLLVAGPNFLQVIHVERGKLLESLSSVGVPIAIGAKNQIAATESGTLKRVRVYTWEAQAVSRGRKQILFLAGAPEATSQVGREHREISERISGTENSQMLNLEEAFEIRTRDLLRELLSKKPHIVHFCGKGLNSGELVLRSESGEDKAVHPEALKELFQALKDNIVLVVFNTCYSDAQAKAVAEVIDFVIGIEGKLDHHHAISFAAALYDALGFAREFQVAFHAAKAILRAEGVPPELMPKLYMREGADRNAKLIDD